MTLPWKLLVIGLAVYSVVLSWAFVTMVRYPQRLHFAGTAVNVDSFSDTMPGLQVTALSVVSAIVVLPTLVAFGTHRDPTEPPR